MEQPYLAVESVSKRFGSVQALDRVSLSCRRGELVAVLGPSGCGKTTLLRIVAGFEIPDLGSVRLGGIPATHLPPEKRGVGLVFQNYALFPHMTVGENIAYGLRFVKGLKRGDIAARVESLLELVDLPGYASRRPDQLSAGQQQRVAIARALAPEPRLLLLDEPLSALDVSLREQLRLNIRRIQRELNLTAVYVTHDQEEAMSVADRIAVMRDGRIEQFGTPEEVYEQPRTAFVASFFGRTALVPVRLAAPDTEFMTGRPGPDALAVLRAESVRPFGPGVPLRGRLEELEFLGHAVRLQLRGEFGTVWATAPRTEVDAWRRRRGEMVTVYFRPEETPTVPAGSHREE